MDDYQSDGQPYDLQDTNVSFGDGWEPTYVPDGSATDENTTDGNNGGNANTDTGWLTSGLARGAIMGGLTGGFGGAVLGGLSSLLSTPIVEYLKQNGINPTNPDGSPNPEYEKWFGVLKDQMGGASGAQDSSDPGSGSFTGAPGTSAVSLSDFSGAAGNRGMSAFGAPLPPPIISPTATMGIGPNGLPSPMVTMGTGDAFTFGAPSQMQFFGAAPNIDSLNADLGTQYSTAADQLDQQLADFSASGLLDSTKASFALARKTLSDKQAKTRGDIEGMFSRNQVLGSSLAAGSLASADKEFEQQTEALAVQEAQQTAQIKLQELDAKIQLMTKASDLRLKGAQAKIDNVFKTAAIAAQDNQSRVALQASYNDLQKGMNAIAADVQNARLQAAVSEADSYRKALLQQQVSGLSADTSIEAAKIAAKASASNAAAQISAENARGVGTLLSGIAEPVISGIGKSLADTIFGSKPSATDYFLSSFGVPLPAAKAGIFG